MNSLVTLAIILYVFQKAKATFTNFISDIMELMNEINIKDLLLCEITKKQNKTKSLK